MTVSLFDLTGKTAFVTGASRGIGRAIAVAFADAGADVALVARSADGLAETAEAIDAVGRKAFVIPADVTDYDVVADAVAAASWTSSSTTRAARTSWCRSGSCGCPGGTS
jgi:NAD(P)-dependent dehydrogenase (short-subunit alcohol dehydrogenase family)